MILVAELSSASILVTDKYIDQAAYNLLTLAGLKVIIAEEG